MTDIRIRSEGHAETHLIESRAATFDRMKAHPNSKANAAPDKTHLIGGHARDAFDREVTPDAFDRVSNESY